MFLKSLSLKGFKSFADPAVLEFEPGITVVVGPNGSGKSNVVDAVAWVLGAQGPRTLRSAKMEDVIFMGTANRPALGRAEVTLTIDNSAGKLATDLAEITITRTLFRSGDSEYAINGAPCRLLDIQELLSDTGVGRQQHVIISQGHLDAILEARPEDRRAVIEEAAGVLKYRRRRERSERRLAATEENLERLFDLVREVKRQIRPLERQAAAARSYTGLADELKAVRLYVAGSELRALDERHRLASDSQTELRATEARLRASLAELDADTERTADEMSAQRESDLASALGRAEGMVERARGLAGVLRERQRSLALALDAAADADVVSTLEAEGARLAEELERAEAEAADSGPRTRRGGRERGRRPATELERHLEAWGDGAELRQAEEAVTVARGAARLARARPRARPALSRPAGRPAGRRRAAGRRTSRARTMSWASGWPSRSRARHQLQAAVAETEAAHGDAVAPSRGGRRGAPPGRAGAPPLDGPGRCPRAGLRRGAGAAGAELLAGVDGVVGTLLDLVEVDAEWEDAFEAAAGAALAAVVVVGTASRPRPHCPGCARAAPPGRCWPSPMPLRPDRAPGGRLPGTESVRDHVRPRRGSGGPSRARRCSTGCWPGSCCAVGGWSEAIDLALARPDLVVVTRDGDRFSSTGWRVRAAGGWSRPRWSRRRRPGPSRRGRPRPRRPRSGPRPTPPSSPPRRAAAEAVRADDRNEAAHQTARAGPPAGGGRPDGSRPPSSRSSAATRGELEERIARDAARCAAELASELPGLDEARGSTPPSGPPAARQERRRIDERDRRGRRPPRNEWEVRSAGLVERRQRARPSASRRWSAG